MKKITLIFVLSFIILINLQIIVSAKESLNEMYPGPWRDDTPISISRALVAANVRGCGEYYYRESKSQSHEYLVYCTRDGHSWTAYIVWDLVPDVMGPYKEDSSVQPPR